MNRVLQNLTGIFMFLLIVHIQICYSNDCYPILQCSPEIAALDYNSINRTIEIKCIFRQKLEDPLDIMWKFQLDKGERMAYDADGQTMPPFKHEILHINETFPSSPYSMSILKVQLLNASYFTNYTIWSVSGGCYQTVRVNLKERALGYTNSCSISNINLNVILFILFINMLRIIR